MNDLISRQALIEAIVNTPSLVQDETIPLQTQYDGATFRQIEILGIIDSMPPAQQWIPVTERLPEMAGIYLVTNSLIGYDELEITYFEDGQWSTAGMPIAWQPLPEPYKDV